MSLITPTETSVPIQQPRKPQQLPFIWKLTSGAIAGVCGTLCIFPIDVTKTRIQAAPIGTYSGVMDCFVKSIRKDGIFIYRGIESNLLGVIPEKAIKLGMNQQLREFFADPETGNVTLQHELIAGGGAGLAQVIATNPMEMLKIRMQLGEKNLVRLVKDVGLTGCYRGTASTLIRDIPFSMVFFTLSAKIKEGLVLNRGGTLFDAPTLGESLIGGMVAGAIAAALSTPADVVKTKIQSNKGAKMSYMQAVGQLYSEGGLGAFGRGVGPRMVTIGPLFGIAVLVYDKVEKMVKNSS